jgi:hypothetical protein
MGETSPILPTGYLQQSTLASAVPLMVKDAAVLAQIQIRLERVLAANPTVS